MHTDSVIQLHGGERKLIKHLNEGGRHETFSGGSAGDDDLVCSGDTCGHGSAESCHVAIVEDVGWG